MSTDWNKHKWQSSPQNFNSFFLLYKAGLTSHTYFRRSIYCREGFFKVPQKTWKAKICQLHGLPGKGFCWLGNLHGPLISLWLGALWWWGKVGLPVMVLKILMETVILQRAARPAFIRESREGNLIVNCSDMCVHVCDSSGSNTALRLDKYLLRGVSFWRRGHGTFKMMSSATCIKAEWNGPGRKRVMSTENRGSVNSSTRGG